MASDPTRSPTSALAAAPPASQPTAALIERRIRMAESAIGSLRRHLPTIEQMADGIADRLRAGGTLYTAGNGGSAAEALHLAEELIGRYRSNRPPFRAVCLAADPTALTCIANDFGFEEIFARPCEALLGPADVLVLFTTSGRSENIRRAAEVGRRKGAWVLGLLGGDGGETLRQCDLGLVVAAPGRDGSSSPELSLDSAAIQEAHQVLLHILCERLER